MRPKNAWYFYTDIPKNKKKIHAREIAKKKDSCKEEGKEQKFMQKEGPGPVAMA